MCVYIYFFHTYIYIDCSLLLAILEDFEIILIWNVCDREVLIWNFQKYFLITFFFLIPTNACILYFANWGYTLCMFWVPVFFPT